MHVTSVSLHGVSAKMTTFGPQDHISKILIDSGKFYEADLLAKIREIHLPGTSIIDVGANIGNHSVFAAKALGAKVYAFEPYKPAFRLLKKNVLLNEIEDRVKMFNVALGETDGRGAIVPGPPSNRGQSYFRNNSFGNCTMTNIDSTSFEESVGIIKIDVEGGEVGVIRGCTRMLIDHRPHIFVEAINEDAFRHIASLLIVMDFVPIARFCWTPTYLFSSKHQIDRIGRIINRFTNITMT